MDTRPAIVSEFTLSERIVRDGHEVVPRFQILAPDGVHTIMVQLPDDPADRIERLRAVRSFMIWKAAHSFLFAAELAEPDAISVIAVTRAEVIGALRRIHRRPLSFGPVEWFGRENVGNDMLSLLPPCTLELSEAELAFMQRAFSEGSVPGISWRSPQDQL